MWLSSGVDLATVSLQFNVECSEGAIDLSFLSFCFIFFSAALNAQIETEGERERQKPPTVSRKAG